MKWCIYINSKRFSRSFSFLVLAMHHENLVVVDGYALQDWLPESGASFHVTSHKECFTNYDASLKGRVQLENDYACEIIGVGDV